MAAPSVCDPCSRRDKTSSACKHCTDCEDNLCSECLDVHGTFKAFKTHHIVSFSLVADRSFNIDKFCTKHSELPLKLFCPDHDVLCCRACMTETHRSCEKLVPIEMASKGVKSSSMFDNISKRVVHLTETGHQFTGEMKNIETHLTESKASAVKDASNLRDRLRKRIDEIYTESISEINETYTRLVQRIEKNKKTVTEKVQNAKDIYEKFETVSKHGSEGQTFFLINLLKLDITNLEADFEKTSPYLQKIAVNFTESDTLPLVRSLGSVTVQEQESRFQFKPMENQSAQIYRPSQFVPNTLQLHKNVSYEYDKDVAITGMCVTTDDRLILCNNKASTKDILVLTSEGQAIGSLELEFQPWNITMEPETSDAWVTMQNASYIQIVDTKSVSLQRRVNTVMGAYCIAFVGNNIAIGIYGKVEIFSKQGIHVKTIQCEARYIHSLCHKDNMLYCADGNNNKIFGLRADGASVFTYTSTDLRGPICITSDSAGNVYVLCFQSKNLHKLTADGKLVAIMLDDKTITDMGYAAAFNASYSKMFIASIYKKTVSVLSCK